MSTHTTFLFARPSFLEGMARVFDIGGTLNVYNTSLNGPQADRLALRADIAALRQDVAIAREQMRQHAESQSHRCLGAPKDCDR